MKLPELKKRFNNKYVIRIVAGVLVVGMLGTSFSAYTVHAEKGAETTESTEEAEEDAEENAEEDSDEDALADLLSDGVSVSEKEIGKEETVYVIADNKGAAQETIVSDHLINQNDESVLEDATTLKDIENVKGDETFTQNGNKLTWQADGNDIYYQGTSNEEAPVTQKITYYLDGEEISPEALAGKSGKVTVRFDYTNNEKVGDVYVPFAAISGLILDEKFSDIQVTNGKVMSDGNTNIVVGYALPGLKESLELEEGDLDDAEIPDYFEFSADVENFELDMTMTMVVNAGNYVGTDGEMDFSSIDDMLDTLVDATEQLEDGSAQIAEGLDTLQSKMGEFSDGVKALQSGIRDYTDGAATLGAGIKSYTDGAATLAGGIGTLNEKSGTLAEGVNTLNSSAQALCSGISLLNKTVSTEFTEAEKKNLIKQVDATIASQKSAIEKQASDTVAAQASAIKSQVASSVDAQTETIQKTVTAGVEQTFTNGLSEQIKTQAAASLNANQQLMATLKAGIEPQVKAAFVSQVAADPTALAAASTMGITIDTYDNAKMIYDAANGTGAADQVVANLVNAQAATVVDTLAQSVADTSKTVSEQVAAGAAVSTAKEVAGEAAVTAASEAAATAAYEGAVSGAEQAAVSAAEQTKQTVASSINAKQENGYSLVSGMNALAEGTQTLADSIPELTAGISTLDAGAKALAGNNDKLNSGVNTLVGNNDALNSGVSSLMTGTTAIVDGVSQLDEGSHTLADGIVQFNEEGIEKIVNAYNGDIKDIVDRLQAVLDAGDSYQTYTEVADGVNGSVKFIYKTAAVKAEE